MDQHGQSFYDGWKSVRYPAQDRLKRRLASGDRLHPNITALGAQFLSERLADVESGELWRGKLWQPDRQRFRRWLSQDVATRANGGTVELAVEGCTGWRFVVEEITPAGYAAHLAEPAETMPLIERAPLTSPAHTGNAGGEAILNVTVRGRPWRPEKPPWCGISPACPSSMWPWVRGRPAGSSSRPVSCRAALCRLSMHV